MRTFLWPSQKSWTLSTFVRFEKRISKLYILSRAVLTCIWPFLVVMVLEIRRGYTEIQSYHRTEVHFASFLSGGFITGIVVDPPEKKLAKHTSVQCTAMWCHIDKNHKYKTNLISSLPIWSASSVNEVKKFDCWTPSIRIRVSGANSYRWKRQFFNWIGQCLKYCNNGAAIPC